MVAGEPTIEPRLENVPVRIPPPSGKTGIYEAQKTVADQYFESDPDKAAAAKA